MRKSCLHLIIPLNNNIIIDKKNSATLRTIVKLHDP